MIRRPRRCIPAALTALVLLAACVSVATSAIQMLAGQRPLISYTTLANAAHDTHWTDLSPAIGGAIAALLGLILLLAAIMPGKPRVLPLNDADTSTDCGVYHRSLRATLRAAVDSVDGVTASRLKLRRSTIAATVRTDSAPTEGLAETVRSAVEHRLDQISPRTRPTVRVKTTPSRSES